MNHLVQKDRKARLHVEADGVASAEPEVVWDLVADASSYSQWGAWDASGYHDPGDLARDGAGAIRWFRFGRILTVEEVLTAERPRRLTYTVVRGTPVRNYLAEVTLPLPTAKERAFTGRPDWDATRARPDRPSTAAPLLSGHGAPPDRRRGPGSGSSWTSAAAAPVRAASTIRLTAKACAPPPPSAPKNTTPITAIRGAPGASQART